jgi:hypothetical protein
MGSMAPMMGQREEQQEKRGEVRAEDDAPRDELAEKIARLGIHEPAEAAGGEDLAAPDRFSPASLRPHRAADQSAFQPASVVRAAGPTARSTMHATPVGIPLPPRDRAAPDARRFAEGRLRRGGVARGPRNEPGTGAPAAARGVLPAGGDHAYVTPPPHLLGVAANRQLQDPNLFSHVNEQAVLLALSQETPEKIVSYACYLLLSDSRHEQQMFNLIFNHCHHQLQEGIIAKITQDRSFCSICVRRHVLNKFRIFFILTCSSI